MIFRPKKFFEKNFLAQKWPKLGNLDSLKKNGVEKKMKKIIIQINKK